MASRVNWGQAFAEVALLLIGAAVAFGIDSWSDSRQDTAAERDYLLALRSDFAATDSTYRQNLAATVDQLGHIKQFLGLLESEPGTVPVDSLDRMVRKSFLWGDFVPVLATYKDLVGSGELSLLQNDSLRIALAEFETYVEARRPYNDIALDQWSSQVTPFYTSHLNVTALYGEDSEVVIGGQSSPGYDIGPPIQRLPSREEAYWSREFMNLLAVRAISLGDAIFNMEPAVARVGTILRLIEKSLSETR